MTLQTSSVPKKPVIVGNYRFTGRRLGKGNFAKVEEAQHTVLNVKVAIKIMDVGTIKEDYVIRNLYREARIMSRLSHPCIAAIYQTMQYGNLYYLVTELVDGSDLCNFIKGQRNGRLEEHFTRVFARQLISAISHMHSMGIVHRDLKMENVMLNAQNSQLKIVDFGLSNVYSSNNPLRTHCGSPEYAAPELFVEGKHYGPEVDLWSLGVILYGMVVGQLPFISNNRDGITVSAQQRRKKLLEQINKGLSTVHKKALVLFTQDFKAMIAKLLVADSSKRTTIMELIFHPWVTEKGRKSIRSNPYKKLDDKAQSTVIKEVATLVNTSWVEVNHAIKADPQGNIGGMYNLLTHSQIQTSLGTDPVVKNNSTSANIKIAEISKTIKSKNVLHSAPIQKMSKLVLQSLTKNKESNEVDSARECNCLKSKRKPYSRPCSNMEEVVFVPLRRQMSSTLIKSANAKSNSAQPPMTYLRMSTKCSQYEFNNRREKRKYTIAGHAGTPRAEAGDMNMNATQNSYVSKVPTPTVGINPKVQLNVAKVSGDATRNLQRKNSRTQSATLPQETISQKASNISPANRPLTTGPVHTAERAAKRKSMLPVMTNKPSAAVKNQPKHSPNEQSTIEALKSTMDEYNKMRNKITNSGKHHQEFNNKPIARSIAGYVAKNMSSTLEQVKWIKNTNLNTGT